MPIALKYLTFNEVWLVETRTNFVSLALNVSIWSTEGLFVAGLNLTFDGNDMLLYLTKSLKEKTMSAYPLLLDWVKEQRPGSDKESGQQSLLEIFLEWIALLRISFSSTMIHEEGILSLHEITFKQNKKL